VLIHVVDASSDTARGQIDAVNSVLDELGCRSKPTVMALNKVDKVHDRSYIDVIRAVYPDAVSISAKSGAGLDELERRVAATLAHTFLDAEVEVPASNGKLLAYLKAHAIEQSRIYENGTIIIQCRLPRQCVGQVFRLHGTFRNGMICETSDSDA
jgi:GTP-binding protein HflX